MVRKVGGTISGIEGSDDPLKHRASSEAANALNLLPRSL
jgi:hypothetical protein